MSEAEHNSLLFGPYQNALEGINAIVKASGELVEGNLMYLHHEAVLNAESIYGEFYPKRRNFMAACRVSSCILEIGFNAGHSALLALATGLKYHGVDICEHRYCSAAAQYLQQEFAKNFTFTAGDSLKILPKMVEDAANKPQHEQRIFDLIHIDGNHSEMHCQHDLQYALLLCKPGSWIIFNDTDFDSVKHVYDEAILQGDLLDQKPFGWEDYPRHRIARTPE